MKNITLLFVFTFLSHFINAQDKMLTKTGKITFEASIPSFEEVKQPMKMLLVFYI